MNSKQQNDERADERELRPALRPVEAAKLPPGRQILQYDWWQQPFDDGTTLLWREQVAKKRALLRRTGKMRHDPDRRMTKEVRRHALGCWDNHLVDEHLAREFCERWPGPASVQ